MPTSQGAELREVRSSGIWCLFNLLLRPPITGEQRWNWLCKAARLPEQSRRLPQGQRHGVARVGSKGVWAEHGQSLLQTSAPKAPSIPERETVSHLRKLWHINHRFFLSKTVKNITNFLKIENTFKEPIYDIL